MKWQYWIELFTETHCVARGLRPKSIAAYSASLHQFREYVHSSCEDMPPDKIMARDVLEYLQHLREVRGNGDASINRHVVILKSFYRAMVAMNYLGQPDNPMVNFPNIKSVPRKIPVTLTEEEVPRLLNCPPSDTVLGLRDRAILTLLYGSGIRASECAALVEADVDLVDKTIFVSGKGGHERIIPLNKRVVKALTNYRIHRGEVFPDTAFFRSKRGAGLSRNAIYERVRTWGQRSRLLKRISPHSLRHTFASHLVASGVKLVTIRDFLGHKLITSTQIYLHVTSSDLRNAAERHPIKRLLSSVDQFLPKVSLPMQYAPGRRGYN